jgi:hypothetical protein
MSASHPVCFNNTHRNQWSLGTRKGNIKRGQKVITSSANIFFSEAFTGSKKYYSEMEKMCYAVVMSARKLRHYVRAHRVIVLTNQPLNALF